MSRAAPSVAVQGDVSQGITGRRVLRFGLNAVLIFVAAAIGFVLVQTATLIVRGDFEVVDFRPYYLAGQAVVHGDTLYPATDTAALASGREYVYPPLTAILVAPLTVLSITWAAAVWVVLLGAVVVATVYVAGVRDWRCYPVALLWVPTLNAVGLGQVTALLGLGAALAWKFRDHDRAAALSVGATLALKLILWPLVVWLAAIRRRRSALYSVAVAALLFILSWAVVGFAGLDSYFELLRRIRTLSEDDAYSVFVVATEAGVPAWIAHSIELALAAVTLVGCVLLGRRGNERGAFVLAIATALLTSPIVWRHYFELLIPAVAVAQPTLGAVWFVPLAMWFVSTGMGNGTPRDTAATVGLAALTVVLAVHATRRNVDDVPRSVLA
jgi:alpha-1,2-mannosyltransferase